MMEIIVFILKIIASLVVTYEFMKILTENKKYLSVIGTVIIVCSSFMKWFGNAASIFLILGEFSLIILNEFMLTKNKKIKILWSLLFSFSIILCFLNLYPAWIISFGYIFLSLAIWIIIKNKKEYKFEKFDIFCILLIIILCSIFVIYFYSNFIGGILHEIKIENGGRGITYLFSYLYNFLLPFIPSIDAVDYAGFLSFFPIPIIIGMIYLYREEKHTSFILPLLISLVLQTVWCISGLPSVLAKITFLNFVPVEYCAAAIGLGSIYLYIYMISNIDKKLIKQTSAMYIMLAILILLFFIPVPGALNTRKNLYIAVSIETLGGFLLLNIGDKKYNKVFLSFTIIMTVIYEIIAIFVK